MTRWVLAAGDVGNTLYDAIDRGGVVGLLCVVITVIVVGAVRGWYSLPQYTTSLLERIRELQEHNKELRDQNQELRRQNGVLQESVTAWREESLRVSGVAEAQVGRPRRRPPGNHPREAAE